MPIEKGRLAKEMIVLHSVPMRIINIAILKMFSSVKFFKITVAVTIFILINF